MRSWAPLLSCLILAISCSNPTTGPSARPLSFRGQVVEFSSGSPVANAAVRFTPESGDMATALTGANGEYVMEVPRTGAFTVMVDGVFLGTALVNGTSYPGDLLVRGGNCISRYGLIIDSRTLRPVRGATVLLTGRSVVTGADGRYRIDLGCPDMFLGGGTTLISVTHPDYEDRSQVVGRGVFGVSRLDLDLTRR